MELRNIRLSIPTVLLLLLLVSGVVSATIYFTLEVPSVIVVLSYEIELWDEGKTAVVSSFDFGQISPGETAYSAVVWLKNKGDAQIWWRWYCDEPPVGLTVSAEHSNDGVTWTNLADTWHGIMMDPNNGALQPGDFYTARIRFKVVHTIGESSSTLNFVIKFDAASTKTG